MRKNGFTPLEIKAVAKCTIARHSESEGRRISTMNRSFSFPFTPLKVRVRMTKNDILPHVQISQGPGIDYGNAFSAVGKKKRFLSLTGFTLIEVIISLAVFSLIIASASGIFVSIQQSWQKQKNSIELTNNLRWAMEFMTNEIRSTIPSPPPVKLPASARLQIQAGGERVSFGIDTDGDFTPDTTVWYWRGNTASDATGLGDSTYIYRGTVAGLGAAINAAYNNRKQLANFIVTNPSGNDIFSYPVPLDTSFVIIELTVRPNPLQPQGRDNFNYAARTRVKIRN